MSGIPCKARPKNGRGRKKSPRAFRGKKRKKFVIWKKIFFCRLEKQNVGWKKNLPVGKKNVGWRSSPAKTDMSGVPEFPVMPDRKTAEAGKKHPRAYKAGGKRKKNCQLEKKKFVGWKNKMLVGKNLSVETKKSVGEFPLPKTDMSGMSGIPCRTRPKNGRGGKKTSYGI